MIRGIIVLTSILVFVLNLSNASARELALGDARRVAFDADWRFLKGDAPGAEQPGFDDAGWPRLDLPHDSAIEGPFDPKYEPHNGALPFYGVGWYRKHFTVPASARGKYFSLEFDGAMANSRVWLNGMEIGGRPYGYIGFAVDLTPQLRFDGDNVLAVKLSPEDQSSRWYPGAGIYRHVWLDITGPVHVDRWGTYVTTPSVSDKIAKIKVAITIRNRLAEAASVNLSFEHAPLQKGGGGVGGYVGGTPVSIPARETATFTYEVDSELPMLWDVDHPNL